MKHFAEIISIRRRITIISTEKGELLGIEHLTRDQLAARLVCFAASEASSLADLLEHLAEFDRRREYEPQAYPSLFEYCVGVLRYSESAAAKRICAARLAAKHPILLELVRSRRLHLEGVVTLSPVLTAENASDLLAKAEGRSKREIERLVASISNGPAPKADVIRFLPSAPRPEPPPLQEPAESLFDKPAGPERRELAPSPAFEPRSPAVVRIAFTAGGAFLSKLEMVRGLLAQKHPSGDLLSVFETALDAFLTLRDPLRPLGDLRSSASHSRRPPRWVRYEVWKRDGGRCSYLAEDGRRCDATRRFEYDHIRPWAVGGRSDDPENIRLLCRVHNQMRACDASTS